MLAYVTSGEFLLDGFSNAWPVQMLTNHFLCPIQSWMKQIHVIPFHYVFLEFLWNDYFIFICYKIYFILASAKITLCKLCAFRFFHQEGLSPLIAVYGVKRYRKCAFRQFFDVVEFQHSLCCIRLLMCSILITVIR